MAPEQGPQGQAMEQRERAGLKFTSAWCYAMGKSLKPSGVVDSHGTPSCVRKCGGLVFVNLDTNWSRVEDRTPVEELPPSGWPVGTSVRVFSC